MGQVWRAKLHFVNSCDPENKQVTGFDSMGRGQLMLKLKFLMTTSICMVHISAGEPSDDEFVHFTNMYCASNRCSCFFTLNYGLVDLG